MQRKTNVEHFKLFIELDKFFIPAVQLESFEKGYLSTRVPMYNCSKTNRCVNKCINLLGSIYASIRYKFDANFHALHTLNILKKTMHMT
jgi:hypothetical protein